MAFTTDLTTDIGKVRLLLTDLDSTKPIFPDDQQIETFLAMEGDDVKCAAALAMQVIAGNRVLTMQVVKLLDLEMDGRQTAEALLKAAKTLRDSSDEDWCGFDVAGQADLTPFVYREHLLKLLEGEV